MEKIFEVIMSSMSLMIACSMGLLAVFIVLLNIDWKGVIKAIIGFVIEFEEPKPEHDVSFMNKSPKNKSTDLSKIYENL
jgi:hypothetical protein